MHRKLAFSSATSGLHIRLLGIISRIHMDLGAYLGSKGLNLNAIGWLRVELWDMLLFYEGLERTGDGP